MIVAAAAVGALFGSRLLGILEQEPAMGALTWRAFLLPGGKTIVGGLLGGWLLVELTKRWQRLSSRTGDLFAVPLCVGIAIGRVGCFFAGIADDTYGDQTALPWGIDFGDGARRHPTQLYEILFLLALAAFLAVRMRRPYVRGSIFRIFLASYLGFRLVIDFLKPQPVVLGMSVIQWACLGGLMLLVPAMFSEHDVEPRLSRGEV